MERRSDEGGEVTESRSKKPMMVRIGRGVRDAWLIVGLTLLLIVGLEVAYLAQGAARRALFGESAAPAPPAPTSPFDTTSWAAEYHRDHRQEEEIQWTPYVYFRNPTFDGTHMSVDSAGHRVTPQPEGSGSRTVEVFFLGGSTTFGWFQRDAHTIPAVAARQLQDALVPGSRLRVTNFGVPGHTFTQEILELMLELRAGRRPDVVVFYDGINDVMATVQNGVAGVPQNEANRVADFERGRRVAEQDAPGLVNDVRALARSAWAVAQRLELVKRIRSVRAPDEPGLIPADSAASSLARVYVENVRLVEALADDYGFTPVYVWQPALLSSGKRLTAREEWLRGPAERDPEIRLIQDVHRAVPPLLRDTVPKIVGDRFIDATPLFDRDTLEVFADLFGHTYERANPAVVDTLLPLLSEVVAEAGRRPAEGGRD